MVETWNYNSRLQPRERLAARAGTTQLGLGLYYCGTQSHACGDNNGNPRIETIAIPGQAWTRSFGYDGWNRVSTAGEGSDYRNFGYSATGNMWVTASSAGWTPPSFTPRTSAWFDANNRLVNAGLGVQYDTAGSQTAIGGYTFTYDAEGRMTASTIAGSATAYAYDGEGRRVKKTAVGVSTVYVYGAGGELMAEYGGPAQAAGTRYVTTDHLGSTRLVTDASGSVVSRHDYLPFGEEIPAGVGGRTTAMGYVANPAVTQKFTGKERDGETGLDFMEFRYYGGAQGRFLSPDPLMASANVADPQSWNRYVYARNNPLRYNDPLGLYASPSYDCSVTQPNCLNDEQRRILENSLVKVGKEILSGEKLWSALGRRDNGEALQNAFVNITDKLGSITLEGGGTALSQVSGLTDVKADRLYANVSSGLAGALAGSPAFTSVSAGDHAPYNAISYKNVTDVRGNIQLSFNESRRGADIDIDLGNMASKNPMGPLIHIREVLQNKITNTTTSQDAVRKILMENPSVMITPSPDPKWNRK